MDEINSTIKCIFKSEQEHSLYIVLRNKYSNYNVIPNYEISRLIKLDEIKELLTQEEYNFLISDSAYFNIVIFNKEGFPLKVFRILREGCHNEKEWIKKDAIITKVCELANLEYEEVY